jgi:hypothetical protein
MQEQHSYWGDFFSFRRMITPVIIQVLFWIGVAIAVIAGLVTMVTSFGRFAGGFLQFLSGLGILILGPIAARVLAEALIVYFRINETLTDIRATLLEQRPPAAPPQEPPSVTVS